MAWAGPSSSKPVWCTATGKPGPTSGAVSCTTTDPGTGQNPELAQAEGLRPIGQGKEQSGTELQPHPRNEPGSVSDMPVIAMPVSYQKFTDQIDLGHYLMQQYHIRRANELSSCETCHR
jgi:hypothetical protein